MSEWKTIDSAPRDGTHVLLFVEQKTIEGWWFEGDPFDSEWQVVGLSSHGCGCCSYPNKPPTHWMPLPKGPANE
jgi:hypothetical protein